MAVNNFTVWIQLKLCRRSCASFSTCWSSALWLALPKTIGSVAQTLIGFGAD